MNAVDRFLISYLVPQISTCKEPKHDTQNWFTANNNNNRENYDVIRLACLSVTYKIDNNSTSTHVIKLCKQKVARGIRSNLIEVWLSKQHSRSQALFIQNNDS